MREGWNEVIWDSDSKPESRRWDRTEIRSVLISAKAEIITLDMRNTGLCTQVHKGQMVLSKTGCREGFK